MDPQVNWMIAGAIATVASAIIGAVSGFLAATVRVGQYIQKVDDLKDRMVKVEGEIKDHSSKLVECSTKIDERTSPYSSLTKRKSPITLSEKGEELLKKSGADKFVLENTNKFVEAIKARNPKTAYDVQAISREVLQSFQDHEEFNPFKDFAFKEGLDLEPIFIVMSIFLRDIALPLLGFKYEELDKTDPSLLKDRK